MMSKRYMLSTRPETPRAPPAGEARGARVINNYRTGVRSMLNIPLAALTWLGQS